MSRNPLYDYAKQLEEKASKIEVASKGLVKGIKKIIPQKATTEYKNIANTVIKEFYDSYTPDYYNNRTYSLYNAFKIKSGYGWVDWTANDGDGGGLHSTDQAWNNLRNTINNNIEVILFHDYNGITTAILPDVIDYLRENGYECYPLFYESNMINK